MSTFTRVQDTDLQSRLALWRVPGLGARLWAELLDRLGSPEAVLAAAPGELTRHGAPDRVAEAIHATTPAHAEPDLRWLEADPAHHVLRKGVDPAYPARLAELPDAPPLLFAKGDPGLLAWPGLAIVGSRNPSHNGRELARDFAQALATRGLGINSGLAQGIDAAAHQGALDAGGVTIAVMGTGPDRVYPARNRKLAHAIAAEGVLITELPVGVGVRRSHFPRRNRIISGLSLGTLVVEASLNSGSLITAYQALDQGRDVFAIPGSIHNPMARGCHRLIRDGARLVESVADILEELDLQQAQPLPAAADNATPDTIDTAPRTGPAEGPDPEYATLLEAMGHDPVALDTLVSRAGLTADAVSSMLLLLELQGRVQALPGGRYQRTGPEDV